MMETKLVAVDDRQHLTHHRGDVRRLKKKINPRETPIPEQLKNNN
jgi:hypothetical protein